MTTEGFLVEVVEDERVAERGTARTHWRVRRGDGWIPVAEWPGAEIERLPGGPGIVFERAIRLVLPEGTELERVEVRPRRAPSRDPLAYLERAPARAPRTTRRVVLRVARNGKLVPAK